jgi:hypothetical protein
LVEEVDEIKDTVSLLSQQLNEAEVARANLIQVYTVLYSAQCQMSKKTLFP